MNVDGRGVSANANSPRLGSWRRRATAVAAALALVLLCAPTATAAPGDLDLTFSLDGRQTTNFSGENDEGQGVAVQTDGKLVVVGFSISGDTPNAQDFALSRYSPDGTLDSSFSGDGRQTTDFAGSTDLGQAVVVQPDGKIVVAGSSNQGGTGADFALARYNADGTPDSSFSGDGRQTTDFAGSSDAAAAVALEADGSIVVAGTSQPGAGGFSDFALARYDAQGTPESSFSGDGRQMTDFAGGSDEGGAVAVQADGKIVAAGVSVQGATGADFALLRYNADGTPDNSFSGDGRQTTDFAGDFDRVEGVALEADGKIVVAGTSQPGPAARFRDFALARYDADGTLDSSFSGDGRQTTDFGRNDIGTSVVLDADGKVVVAGASLDDQGGTFALARYDAGGTLDNSFSGDGRQTTAFPGGFPFANAVALQADGKIVLAGTNALGGQDGGDFALARYEGRMGVAYPNPPDYPNPLNPSQPPRSILCDGRTATIVSGSGTANVVGTPGDDVIVTGAGNDTVDGRGGRDRICTGAGNDRVNGGAGNDRVFLGFGADRASAEAGNDFVSGSTGDDVISGGRGNDRLRSNSGNDRAGGGSGNDRVIGDRGNDRVSGDSGNDIVGGTQGNDRVGGGSGNDRVGGNSGNDRIDGGSGRDRVNGGNGRDLIDLSDGFRDFLNCSSGRDRVTRDRRDKISRLCEIVIRRD